MIRTDINLSTLVQLSVVVARFLKVGEIIERGGHLMIIEGEPIADPMWIGRVQLVVRDLEGDDPSRMMPLSLNAELFVPTYDSI